MTSPIPGPSSDGVPQPGLAPTGAPQPVPAPTAAPGGYAPQGELPTQGAPASYVPTAPAAQVAATQEGAPQGAPQQAPSYSAPTGEGWSGRSLSESERRTQESLLTLKSEIGKAVVGQDGAITGLIVALVAGGHARGHHGLHGVGRGSVRVRVPRGPGVHEPAARRRNQPHSPQDSVRAAGVHGGTHRLDRR